MGEQPRAGRSALLSPERENGCVCVRKALEMRSVCEPWQLERPCCPPDPSIRAHCAVLCACAGGLPAPPRQIEGAPRKGQRRLRSPRPLQARTGGLRSASVCGFAPAPRASARVPGLSTSPATTACVASVIPDHGRFTPRRSLPPAGRGGGQGESLRAARGGVGRGAWIAVRGAPALSATAHTGHSGSGESRNQRNLLSPVATRTPLGGGQALLEIPTYSCCPLTARPACPD